MVLSPLFAILWLKINQTKYNPSLSFKFSSGILLAGLGFLALVAGSYYLNHNSKIHLAWIVLAFLLHTVGELCISPIGLSAVTTLSPKKWVGALMGCWFLGTAFSQYIGALIAKLTTLTATTGTGKYHEIYINVFNYIGKTAIAISILVFAGIMLVNLFRKKFN